MITFSAVDAAGGLSKIVVGLEEMFSHMLNLNRKANEFYLVSVDVRHAAIHAKRCMAYKEGVFIGDMELFRNALQALIRDCQSLDALFDEKVEVDS